MTSERIRELYDAQPFQPFVIHTADGRKLMVQHKEFVAFAPSGRTVVVHTPEDRMHIIDLHLITAVKVKKAKSKKSGRNHG
jgi:hypothetical protein